MESLDSIFRGAAGEPFETWEVGAARLNVWLPRSGGDPFRPWIVVCRSAQLDRLVSSDIGDAEDLPALVRGALERAAAGWRRPPLRIEVADAELAAILERLLDAGEVDVAVEVAADLPELRRATAELAATFEEEDDATPSPLTGDGVTLAQLAAFAGAAADLLAFDGSLLSWEDLLRVEAPEPETGFEWLVFERGRRRHGPGLIFLPDREAFGELMEGELDRMMEQGHWWVEIQSPWDLPLEDLDLWERQGLPWAGDRQVPVARYMVREEVRRPDARQLAFLEGVMRALAAATEAELDAGRWEREVPTFLGPMRFALSLPGLLEAGPERPDGMADEEWALELVDEAYDALGRREVRLAHRALEVWPDCAEAYVLLAQRSERPEQALSLFEAGLAAAERAGRAALVEGALDLDAAGPYLRCRFGLAGTLLALGREEEAVGHLRDLLRLDPEDADGARHLLIAVLLDRGRDAEAAEILGRFPDGPFTTDPYCRALLAFRREGASFEARLLLRRALQGNPSLSPVLSGRFGPFLPDLARPVGRSLAFLGIQRCRSAWERTPGALDWLAAQSRPRPDAPRPVRRKAGRKAGKKARRRR